MSRRRPPEQDAWMAERYPDASTPIDGLCAEFERLFGEPMTPPRLRDLCARRGIRRSRKMRWTAEMHEFMRGAIPGRTEGEIAGAFEERFGVRLTRSQIKAEKSRLGVRSGTCGGRFEQGREAWNKGLPIAEWMAPEQIARCSAARFQPGAMPPNGAALPVGSERVSPSGYVEVKVAERPSPKAGGCGRTNDNWRPKHRLVWEEANGRPVPEGSMVVFADGDRLNFDPENLVLVERSVWAVVSRNRMAFADRDTLLAAIDVARARKAIYAAKSRPRPCRRCGEAFEPRYDRQRTCDRCLGRAEGGE